ncbi:MAG: hypothetical protein HYY84_06210 [Deltaproteobacteria bacterium]|nr:hypothetical protein [Deltaproteobacteria bacterium]
MLKRSFALCSVVVVGALLTAAPIARAQSPKALFTEGKALYDGAKYREALAKFQAALGKEATGKAAYHAGLAALKLKQHADAVRYFAEAEKLDANLKSNAVFQSRYADAKARAGASAAASPAVPSASPPVPAPAGSGGVRLSADPVKDRIMRDLAGNKTWVKDYTNTFTPDEVAMIQSVANDAAGRGVFMKVVMVPTPPEGEAAFATRLGRDWANLPREVLVVGFARGAFAYAKNLTPQQITQVWEGEPKRAFIANRARGLSLYASGVLGLELRKLEAPVARPVAPTQPMRVMVVRTSTSNTMWIIILAIVGGIILIVIIAAVVNRGRQKAAQTADYKTLYKNAIEALLPLGKEISDVQLTLQIVPDDEAQRLVDRAEEGYFQAQEIVGKLPRPDDGNDLGSAQRANGLIAQAEKEAEHASTIANARAEGKEINLEELRKSEKGKLGCYFCSKPISTALAKTVGVESKGMKMDVTACNRCFRKYEEGQQPEIKMVNYQGQRVHWSQVPGYDPYYDYYYYNRYQPSWVDWMIMDSLFHSHSYYSSPYVTIHEGGGGASNYFNYDTYRTEHAAEEAAAGSAAGGGLVGDGSADAGASAGSGMADRS